MKSRRRNQNRHRNFLTENRGGQIPPADVNADTIVNKDSFEGFAIFAKRVSISVKT